MNLIRYIFSVLAIFIVFEGINYLVNYRLLTECYNELDTLWRKDLMDRMWLMYLLDLILILLMVSVYSRWSRRFTAGSGILFGLITGVMVSTIGVINQWIVYPLTNHITMLWVFFGIIQYMAGGLLMGLIYKPRKVKINQ